jgi:protein-ribulosamine 3-kinase
MMEGEYNSMKEIEKYMPSFVPRPCVWGKFRHSPPDTYFFLMEFCDLETGQVDPASFCARLAELHTTSNSPDGRFGFHLVTCHGPNAQNTDWNEDWCYYFTRLLEQFFYREIASNGSDDEYENMFETLKSVVIPKILKPLQADGRTLKPSLIHGDLWEENTDTDLVTGEPLVFDAAAHYAHNEFELGMWRRDIVRFSKSFFRQYLRQVPPSEPREQWDDRNRLYSIKYDLAHSIALPDTSQDQRDL